MYLCCERTVEMFAVVMILRQTSGFVAPVRAGAVRQAAAAAVCGVKPVNVRCLMSAGAKAATPERVGLSVLDAQAAELKAERLWGMADARKPRPSQKEDVMVEVSEAVESVMRGADALPSMESVEERDSFVEEQGEVSALRRYQYNELVDCENDDDDKEYYI